MHTDENKNNKFLFSERDNLIINAYYVILDKLSNELNKRKSAYEKLVKKFFLSCMKSLRKNKRRRWSIVKKLVQMI